LSEINDDDDDRATFEITAFWIPTFISDVTDNTPLRMTTPCVLRTRRFDQVRRGDYLPHDTARVKTYATLLNQLIADSFYHQNYILLVLPICRPQYVIRYGIVIWKCSVCVWFSV